MDAVPLAPAKDSIWIHYKHTEESPKRYQVVVPSARHSETAEQMVVYRTLYDECGVWVRPLTMWYELVTVHQPWPHGPLQERPRFVPQVTTLPDELAANNKEEK
jgi:hypothetical protein